jgi:hypothetical protein
MQRGTLGANLLVSYMTRSPAGSLDVVREHYRRVTGSLILGNAIHIPTSGGDLGLLLFASLYLEVPCQLPRTFCGDVILVPDAAPGT